jgi:trigger factor
MDIKIKNLPKSEKELTIELTAEEVAPFMQHAAMHMSEHAKIEGFRPGKAPYDIIKSRFGEAAILEEAAEEIVRKKFFQAIKENNLETVGQPKVEITKQAPGNAFIFKATVAVLPEITLGEYKNLSIKKEVTPVTDEQVTKVMTDLAKMQSKEVIAEKVAASADKVVIDMEMTKDGVIVEGGSAKNMAVYLFEQHYIKGFNDELIGLKAGDEKTFTLTFPKNHYQKNLAGGKIDFKVKVNGVYEITPPEINEDFAKALGQKSLEDLKALLRKNMEAETAGKDNDKWEMAIMNKIVANGKFGDIPETLINEEAHKMVHELEHNIEREGMNFEEYLKSMNKKESDLMLEMAPEATKRIKVALAVRTIGKLESITSDDKEIAEETTRMVNAYKDDAEAQKQIREPGFVHYLRTKIENRKTIEAIKKANE